MNSKLGIDKVGIGLQDETEDTTTKETPPLFSVLAACHLRHAFSVLAVCHLRHAFCHWRQTTPLLAFLAHVNNGLRHIELARICAQEIAGRSIHTSSLVSRWQMVILESDTDKAGLGAWIHRERNTLTRMDSERVTRRLSELTCAVGQIYRPLLLIDHMEATRQVSRIAQEPRSRYFGEGSFEQLHDDAANTAALDPLKRLLVAAFTPPHGDNEAFAHRMKTGFGVIVALLRRIWDPRCTHGMLSKITAVIDQALPVSQIKTLYNGTLLFEYSRQVGCFASRPPPEISAQHTTLNENYIYH